MIRPQPRLIMGSSTALLQWNTELRFGLDHLVPLVGAHLPDAAVPVHARIVHQHVDGAQLPCSLLEQLVAVFRPGHVGVEHPDPASTPLELGGELVRLLPATAVVHRQGGALGSQRACDRLADATRRAGDDGHLARQPPLRRSVHLRSLSREVVHSSVEAHSMVSRSGTV